MKTLEERFWEKVDCSGDCWEWTASKDGRGYGQFHISGANYRAHRVAYELSVGEIPEGLDLDHLCMNKACVNPSHLEPVTRKENIARWGATVTHCPKGHEYSEDNIYWDAGYKKCKICVKARSKERRNNLKK